MRPARLSRTLMAMTVALLDLSWGGAILREVTLGDRISARLHGAELDRALVSGVRPEAEVPLMLHARRLIAPRTRRGLARTLHGAVDAARRRPSAPVPARPVGFHVTRAAPELLALAERLERPGAVDARGVALARQLLRDGLGPLYAERRGAPLAEAAREAAAALEPAELG